VHKAIAFVLCLFLVSCQNIFDGDDDKNGRDRSNSPTNPSPLLDRDTIEFRVFGAQLLNAFVTIRHTNSLDGQTNYVGTVPYGFTFQNSEEFIFLYIEATAVPSLVGANLQVQIYVNGRIFREASSQGFTLYSQAFGTYRR
jgi:hypothetical protein